jgi:cytochrome c-type protein NapB
MKKSIRTVFVLALGLIFAPTLGVADGLRSERGDVPITGPSLESQKLRVVNDKEPVPVAFEEQPPLIPHKVERYVVNLSVNECMDCHSRENAAAKDATEVSESHYQARDGDKLDNLAARRYFCAQCHVPQLDTDPLIENVFQPLASVGK